MTCAGDRSDGVAYIGGIIPTLLIIFSMKSVFGRGLLLSCVLVVIIGIHQGALAQGEFVARGETAVKVSGELAPDGDRTNYFAEAGFSVRGVVDLRLGYGWLDATADTLGGHMSGRSIRPAVGLHLIRQGERFPFSLSAVGSYQSSTWDGDDIGADDVTGATFEVGGILHTIIQIGPIAGIRPFAGLFYQKRERDYEFADGAALGVEQSDLRYLGGIQIVVMPTSRTVFFAGPTLSAIGGERTIGATGGVVFN